MATPAITDFILYTVTPLTDTDYSFNWTELVKYVTDGTFDFTIKSLTTTGILSVGTNATISGNLGVTGDTTITGSLDVSGGIIASGLNVMQEIYTTTLSSPQTSVVIPSLDGDVDIEYELTIRTLNAYNGTTSLYLSFNGAPGGTLYGYQSLQSEGTTSYAAHHAAGDSVQLVYMAALNHFGTSKMIMYSKTMATHFPRTGFIESVNGLDEDAVDLWHYGFTWKEFATNITSIYITSNQANAIAAGTVITLKARR